MIVKTWNFKFCKKFGFFILYIWYKTYKNVPLTLSLGFEWNDLISDTIIEG